MKCANYCTYWLFLLLVVELSVRSSIGLFYEKYYETKPKNISIFKRPSSSPRENTSPSSLIRSTTNYNVSSDSELDIIVNESSKNTRNEKCSQTKLSYDVFTYYYTWRVENLLDYISYCRKFGKDFRLQSPDFVFDTVILNGSWKFSLVYDHRSYRLELQALFPNNYKNPREFELLAKIVADENQFRLSELRSTDGRFQWSNITDHVNKSSKNETVEFQLTVNFYHSPELSKVFSDGYSCENDRSIGGKSSSANIKDTPPFTKDLKSLMEDEKYIDVIIKTKNNTYGIQAHRIILANSSPVLASLVYNSTYDKNESIVNMEDIDHDIVQKLVLYLYTGQIDGVENIADQLILVAYRYELNHLKDICESYLLRNVKFDNALQLYSLGMNTLSSKLSKRAFAVMRENKTKLAARSEEFRILSTKYPNLMFELFVS